MDVDTPRGVDTPHAASSSLHQEVAGQGDNTLVVEVGSRGDGEEDTSLGEVEDDSCSEDDAAEAARW